MDMPRSTRFWCALTCTSALLCFASPIDVRADTMYRWKDAQGRTHFGSQPAPGALDVQEIKPKGDSPAINIVSGVEEPAASTASSPGNRRPETAAARRLRELEEREPTSIGGRSEASWRRQALQLEQRIESLEEQLAHAEDQLSSAYALGRAAYYQRRVNRLERSLESAKEALDRFEDRARELGVPPGWLR